MRFCLNCGKTVAEGDIFCNAECEAKWRAESEAKGRVVAAEAGGPQGREPHDGAGGDAGKAGAAAREADGGGGGGAVVKQTDTSGGEGKGTRRSLMFLIPVSLILLLALGLVGGVWSAGFRSQPTREVTLKMRAPKVLGCRLVRDLAREFLKNEGASEPDINDDAAAAPCEKTGELKVSGLVARDATRVTLEALLCDSSAHVFDGMLSGECDLGISWRPVSPGEKSKLKEGGFGDMLDEEEKYRCTLARDGIAVIVHGSNPLNSISQESLRRIFTRQVCRWDQLSSPDNRLSGPINVYAPSEKVEIVEPFRKALGLAEPITEAEGVEVFDDSARVSYEVTEDERGIGFVNAVNRGERSKQLWVLRDDGGQPTAGAAAHLPFSYPLYLYTSPKANDYAGKFRKFVIDGKARKPLEDARLDPLIPKQTPASELKRSHRYRGLTEGAFQLDFNCLFGPNDWRLKGDSLARVEAWVKSRSRPDDRGFRNVLILGFASKDGDGPMNRKLSEDRAREVAKVVGKYMGPVTVEWFGADEPLFGSAEDETDEGKRLNRRVEIWLRP
jgi:phosphate transport system substrate-binding protein